MTRRLAILTVVLANFFLAAGFIQQQAWGRALVCLLLAAFWVFFNLRGMTRWNTACFAILAGLAVICIAGGAVPLLPFLGFMSGLAAWDLTDFSARLDQIVPAEAAARSEKLHLTRLAYTLGVAFVAALAGLFINIQLTFISAAILVILAFLGLSFAVRDLGRKDAGRS